MLLNSVQLNSFNTSPIKQSSAILSRNTKYPNLAPLAQDTVSFTAKINRQKDLLDLPDEEILEICKNAIKNDVTLGRGQEATVYKIEDYAREYCVRLDRRNHTNLENLKVDYKLDDYDKANFVVAKLGEGVTLLEYISGVPLKIMRNSDTPAGIKVKESLQELIANNFPESAFLKVINQIEINRKKGIIFDRKGENLLVDPMIQELTAIDFSPKFNDIEYNPIAYIYHALDVDSTKHAPAVLGKLCNAYAEHLKTANLEELNIDVLDKNFYHRGFMDDAFNNFPDKELLENVRHKLFDELLEKKKTLSPEDFAKCVDEFKIEVEFNLIDGFGIKNHQEWY